MTRESEFGSVTVLKSFVDAADQMGDAERGRFYHALCRYSLYGEEPEKLAGMAGICFNLVKPVIDKSNQRRNAQHSAAAKRRRKGLQTGDQSEIRESEMSLQNGDKGEVCKPGTESQNSDKRFANGLQNGDKKAVCKRFADVLPSYKEGEEEEKETPLKGGKEKEFSLSGQEVAEREKKGSFKGWSEEEFRREVEKVDNFEAHRAAFCDYWTERSASGRMRFQLEKAWETGKRCTTWKRRAEERLMPGRPPAPGENALSEFERLKG